MRTPEQIRAYKAAWYRAHREQAKVYRKEYNARPEVKTHKKEYAAKIRERDNQSKSEWKKRNKAQNNVINQRWRKEHKERFTQTSKAWRDANRDRLRKQSRARYQAKREHILESLKTPEVRKKAAERAARLWAAKPERYRQKQRERRKANPEKYRMYWVVRRTRVREAAGSCTPKQWMDRVAYYGWRCAYCKTDKAKLTVDHVIPVSRGGTGWASNLRPACMKCNQSKNCYASVGGGNA